ncbi:hypothetical protein JCM10207_001625 [Rhodosporidiobolus poonsookiae]
MADITEKAQQLQLEETDAASSHDPQAEKRLVRKLDLILSPLFFIVYLITFIDRANVGNARVAGLETDLGLVGYQYNISLTVFYIFYACWEMPSNVVCKILGARIWLPLQVVAFGIICMCTAFVQNFGGFVVVRILLGIAEGGVLPAMSLVLSRFYKKDELVFRVALFVSAAALAGGFGGLLASGFIAAGPIKGVGAAWRTIFFAEGIITIGIGAIVAIFSVSGPEDAWWLTPAQRELAQARIKRNVSNLHADESATGPARASIWRYLATPAPWICSFGCKLSFQRTVLHLLTCSPGADLASNVTVQGVSLFSPTIIKAMYPGMSTVQIQLRSPPYVVAWVWSLAVAYFSARINRRGIPLLITIPLALVGYAIFVGTKLGENSARYGGIFLNILGAFPGGPMWLAWGINCASTDSERALVSGLVPGFGQFGALIATWTFLPKDAPNYRTGNSMELGFVAFNLLLVVVMLTYVKRENRLRLAGERDHRLEKYNNLDAASQINALGSRHPAWMFPE